MRNFRMLCAGLSLVFILTACSGELPELGKVETNVPMTLILEPVNGGAQYKVKHPVAFKMKMVNGIALGKGNLLGRDVHLGRYSVGQLASLEVSVSNQSGQFIVSD